MKGAKLADDTSKLCPMHRMAKEKIKEIRRKQARLKEKELREWAKKNIPEHKGVVITFDGDRPNTRILRRSVRNVSEHFTEIHLKELSRELVSLCKKATLIERVSLDPTAHNYAKKVARKVNGYAYYKVVYRGLVLRINMEIIEGEEIPYAINIMEK